MTSRKFFGRSLAAIAIGGICATGSGAAHADPVADFYKGKQVSVLIGYGAGGGYDSYARLLARHMGNHIPGSPSLIPRNMTGAGSIVAANAVYNSLPQDGTNIAAVGRGIAMEPLFGRKGPKFDANRINWIGSMNNEVSTCVTWHTANAPTIQDAMERELIIGGTAQGSDGVDFPIILNNVLGTKYKLITGYPGGASQMLAMERGELEGRCGWSWSSIKATRANWLRDKKIHVTLQIALQGNKALTEAGVPLVMDLAKNPRDKKVLNLIFARQTMGRPFMVGPDVPAERVAALRAAFDAALADPALLSDASKSKMEIDPVSGEAIQALVSDIYDTPTELVERAAEVTARTEGTSITQRKAE